MQTCRYEDQGAQEASSTSIGKVRSATQLHDLKETRGNATYDRTEP